MSYRVCLALMVLALLIACAPAVPAGPAGTPLPPLNFDVTPLPAEMACVVVSQGQNATAEPTEPSLYPLPDESDWTLGSPDAPVTFLEYTDFQAAASPALGLNLARLVEKYPTQVRRVFRHYPLPGNDKSLLAAAAAESAGAQGRFWEMSRLLLAEQAAWVGLSADEFRAWLVEQADGLGLDEAGFTAGLDDPTVREKLLQAQQFGVQTAIPLMPWLLVNGKIYQGPRDFRSLENMTGLLLLEDRQFHECPPFVIDLEKQYYARLQTTQGEIVLQLPPQEAPLAVNNFVFLARQGWYDGVTFHRVIPGYIAQAGDPSGTGLGTPGYAFADDSNDLRFDQPGVVAMAGAGPNSNGSQFFITYRAVDELNGRYVIFGRVIAGMDVLEQLTPRDPSSMEELPDGDVIEKVVIEER